VRLFFCVELDDGVRRTLAEHAGRLRPQVGGGTWVAQDNLHITLRFLGEVAEAALPGLAEVGRTAATGIAPFTLAVDTLGAFPSPRRARVLWAGPARESGPFTALALAIEDGVLRLGFPPETKPALPHITLARFRSPRDLSGALAGATLPPLAVEVRQVTLMRSELCPQGPLYTSLSRWPLGG
jgi:2'-5' RNA ligase